MIHKKNRAGFTLAELLLTVAILVILFGIGFVAVTSYLRNLRLNEMDWTAKEIFIAAQNQLSKAKENGSLQEYVKKTEGKYGTSTPNHYYVIYGNGAPNDEDGWEILMPFGAIDETVRLGGSYIIEFDQASATVTQVYYSDNYEFTEYDAELQAGIESKDTRKRYPGNHGNHIIGWYRGDGNALAYDEIKDTPVLKVENAAELIAQVSGINESNRRILLCVQGLSSGATKTIDVSALLDREYVLDAVTSTADHFINKIVSEIDGKAFIPGENIEVFATVMTSLPNTLSNVKESNHVITNSLFASADFESGGTTAQIANFRHLENLDSLISGVSYGSGTDQINLTIAEQIADLNWNTFRAKVSNNSIVNKDGDSAGVYENEDSAVDKEIPNYYPVSNIPASLTYNGNNRYIENVSVVVTGYELASFIGDAGLFGNISARKSLTVNDLELRNFNISLDVNNGGNAGALVGASSGSLSIKNVIAYNTLDDDSAIGIVSTKDSGGLVGRVSNTDSTKTTISNSAAAVYVKGGTTAGGLVGKLSAGTISSSYVGGHTVKGQFTFPEIPGYTANQQGHPNVWATTGTAGGFIGSSGATISNSYTTASVYSSSGTANLFTGNSDAVPAGCYAAGWTYKNGKIVYPDLWMTNFVDNSQMLLQPSEYNYDPFWDNDYYPYKLIQNTDEVWFLKTHVGDWALPGELVDVIN